MMPMPPTTSDIDATAASRSAMMRLLPSAVSAIWLRFRTEKSLVAARPDAVAARQDFGGLADRRLDAGLIHRLHVNLIHVPDHARLQPVGIRRRRIDPVDGSLLLAWRRNADNLALGRRERNHDQIVLVLPKGRLSLGVENSDDLQRNALGLHHGANRILRGAEELPTHGLAENDNKRRRCAHPPA